MMRIGELCERSGVTPRTVRHYESLGIIPRGAREGSGQHRYPEEMIFRLKKIEQLKALGLNLEEVGRVLPLYLDNPSESAAKSSVLTLLRAHLMEAEAQLTSLTEFRNDLLNNITRFETWLKSHTE